MSKKPVPDIQIIALDAPGNRLGECCIWCDTTKTMWWVDVLEPALWSLRASSGDITRHPIRARRLGSIALRKSGGLLLACEDGLYSYDPVTGAQDFLVDPEPGVTGHRKNDGRADSSGNFWIGTLREADYAPVGAIYRVAPDRSVTQIADGLAIPNGLAFDPARGRMYYADTRAYRIWMRSYEPETGVLGDPEVFATTRGSARPDGSCIDAEGYVWNAEYAGGKVVRYDPSGAIDREIALPVSYPTCCCFGGPNLDRLFVTSASEALTTAQRAAEPLAGKVLAFDPGVHGRAEFRVAI